MSNEIYLQIGGDQPLVIVCLGAVYGPFPDQAAVDIAKEALLQAGVGLDRCQVVPLHGVVTKP
jgi:hypothetical protein